MPGKSRLSAAALIGLVALSPIAATSANAFQVKTTMYCEDGPMFPSCGVYPTYQEPASKYAPPHHGHGRGDTSPAYMKALDSRENSAMNYAGGGGGGGGGG